MDGSPVFLYEEAVAVVVGQVTLRVTQPVDAAIKFDFCGGSAQPAIQKIKSLSLCGRSKVQKRFHASVFCHLILLLPVAHSPVPSFVQERPLLPNTHSHSFILTILLRDELHKEEAANGAR